MQKIRSATPKILQKSEVELSFFLFIQMSEVYYDNIHIAFRAASAAPPEQPRSGIPRQV